MNNRTVKQFWDCYNKLPEEVRDLADKNFKLLKEDPKHKSLRYKLIGDYWSVRIGKNYRALAIIDNGERLWFWIGSHAEYDELV